ncbi:phosphatase PAP2 family protein [Roseibium aggregatum]|nr:phosphatase PAP2 family protein [Roseibium aggregatum]
MNALITNHDGIAGTWQTVTAAIQENCPEYDAFLGRLSPEVRQSIYALELASRLGFTFKFEGTCSGTAQVWHLNVTGNPDGTDTPLAAYATLARMSRPTMAIFKKQLDLVANYADLRQDRAAEIIAQLSTPVEFLRSIAFIAPARTPYTIELLATAQGLANLVEMRIKYALACKRPIEFSPQIQPMILTPTHGTLPSGHSTEAFTLARVLWLLLRDAGVVPYDDTIWGKMFMRQASRIAVNRTVAGVHFPVDSEAGAILGLTLGAYFAGRCQGSNEIKGWAFHGDQYPDSRDFDWTQLYDPATHTQKDPGAWADETTTSLTGTTIQSRPLTWLWNRAKQEWLDLREPCAGGSSGGGTLEDGGDGASPLEDDGS